VLLDNPAVPHFDDKLQNVAFVLKGVAYGTTSYGEWPCCKNNMLEQNWLVTFWVKPRRLA